eukprot:CAMPEP_0181243914 /NCGR_PEP_ID=MMETSP1096-20121128/42550_1 /TAXON_ID=156174 ORGANISM="Chrysochromulina ericina, Strain CCMP281" /NCGR_SAMPLE_ID=MMETSP1096 /ASSEMBLY_ACC=CAM_ASM_000453 /LENGTH=97 /DNA_ID=CAMNT_0023340367 /DNA_START=868 /DNA_END=1158 /DNA_ORIENTATION=+
MTVKEPQASARVSTVVPSTTLAALTCGAAYKSGSSASYGGSWRRRLVESEKNARVRQRNSAALKRAMAPSRSTLRNGRRLSSMEPSTATDRGLGEAD